VCASLYAVYHGPQGLKAIAERVHALASALSVGLGKLGLKVRHQAFFDTVRVEGSAAQVAGFFAAAAAKRLNLRRLDEQSLGIALDETTSEADVAALLAVFSNGKALNTPVAELAKSPFPYPAGLARTTPYLSHPVFNQHHSETELLRYVRHLESRDLSLTHSMIPLGSCTMKLNATTEMIPITWPEFGRMHPFAPPEQAQGYQELFSQLQKMLAEVTGFAGISLQPNAGSQGEYAGLLVIRAYHQSRGEPQRNVCLIPSSAHGTNPASAVMAGFEVVVTRCDEAGNVDLVDLEAKAEEHKQRLGALMVTYPSTHGVFEEDIKRICELIHARGGQVYMDGRT